MKKIVVLEIGFVRILVVLLQLVFLKLFTNHTSLYELGMYYFLFTLSYSLNAFLLVPLDYFQQSNLYKLKGKKQSIRSFKPLNYSVIKLTTALVLIAMALCFIFNASYVKTIPLIGFLALSTYFVNLLRGFINNLEHRRSAIYTFLFEAIMKICFYLLYIRNGDSAASTILYATLSASFATLVLLFFLIRRTEEYRLGDIKSFKTSDITRFSYPIATGAVVNWIQLQGYRMILVPLGLVETVGIYSTVANVGTSGMNAYSTVYAQLFVPTLYKTNGVYIKKYINYALLSILSIGVFSFVFSDFIVELLTKAELVRYSALILYGVASEAGNFLISGLTIFLTINNLTHSTMRASIVGLLSFTISFGVIYFSNVISVNTIGIPIVITQAVIVAYLGSIVYKSKQLVQ